MLRHAHATACRLAIALPGGLSLHIAQLRRSEIQIEMVPTINQMEMRDWHNCQSVKAPPEACSPLSSG